MADVGVNIIRVPLDEVIADPRLFQHRDVPDGQSFNEDYVLRIERDPDIDAEGNPIPGTGYDVEEAKRAPLQVWRNPDDGQLYVYAGYHRLEAEKRRHARGAEHSAPDVEVIVGPDVISEWDEWRRLRPVPDAPPLDAPSSAPPAPRDDLTLAPPSDFGFAPAMGIEIATGGETSKQAAVKEAQRIRAEADTRRIMAECPQLFALPAPTLAPRRRIRTRR